MNMAGATMTYPSGIADAEALKAGNDVIEYSTDPLKAIVEIATRVEKNEIGVDEIESRCARVLAAKLWLSTVNKTDSAHSGKTLKIPASAHPALIRDLYAGAMTLIENKDNLIPIGRLDKIKIATVAVNRLALTEFQRMVDKYTNADHFYINPENEQDAEYVYSKLKGYDIVISGICGLEQKPSALYGVTPSLKNVISRLAELNRSVILWFGNPYGIARLDLKTKPSALLIAYQDNKYTHQTAVQLVFGPADCL
jgi:beta-glucosidase-like glycosyl hydrolase